MSANLHSYDAAIIAWANEQARLLREGQFSKLDIEHIAEEIEDVGKSEKRELRNSMAVLLAHLLKWQYQPGYPGQQLAADDQGTAPGCPRMLEGNAKPKTRPWEAGLVGMVWSDAIGLAPKETGLNYSPSPARGPSSKSRTREFWPSHRLAMRSHAVHMSGNGDCCPTYRTLKQSF